MANIEYYDIQYAAQRTNYYNRGLTLVNWARFYYAVIYIVEIDLLIKMSILTILSVMKNIFVTFLWIFCFINKSIY